jgi:hypothetical protein
MDVVTGVDVAMGMVGEGLADGIEVGAEEIGRVLVGVAVEVSGEVGISGS